MHKAVILIIEDDPDIQKLLSFAFNNEGWKLVMARTAEQGLELLKKGNINCVILDIMLPGMDGFKALKKIRTLESNEKNIPVIMATAKGEESDIVSGLELGADDFIVKPYSPKILAARIRTALRRLEDKNDIKEKTQFISGELKLDSSRHEAYNGNSLLELSATEFSLLKLFLSHPDRVFSRNQIIHAIHGPDYPATDRSVDVQILSLRRKLGQAGNRIETIRGVGYIFRSE